MSHELRTPLNGIAGYVDLLLLGVRGELTPGQQGDLERIRFNQQHLGSLIEDVLSFARIDAGKLVVVRVSVPVGEVLRSVQSLVDPIMRSHDVRLHLEGGDEGIAALGDRDRIVQICVNLLANAARAAGGGDIRLSADVHDGRVLIRVADSGTGIPPDKLEEIFSPFTQLGRSFNAPRAGTGLGLSISRGLAEAMNGTLTVESRLGAGSMFTLALPSS